MNLDSDVAVIRSLYAESLAATSVFDHDTIVARWGERPNFPKLLQATVVRTAPTGKPSPHLPSIRQHFRLEEAIGLPSRDVAKAVNAIFHVTGILQLAPIDDSAWREAIDLARAYVSEGLAEVDMWWEIATCEAARRLVGIGYVLRVIDGAYQFENGHLER